MAVTINGTTGILAPDIGIDGTTLTVDAVNNRVGIATSSPGTPLDVAGEIQSDTGLKVAGHPVVGFSSISGGYAARLGSTGSTTLNKTQIYARGAHVATFDGATLKVGIGTDSPDFKLHSNETGGSSIAGLFETNQTDAFISFQASGTTANSTVRIGAVGDDFRAFISGAERLRITSDGKLISQSTHSNGAVNEALRITTLGTYSSSNSNDAGPAISFGQFHGDYPTWTTAQVAGIRKGNNWHGALSFYTNAGSSETNITEKLRIDANGRILVGPGAIATPKCGYAGIDVPNNDWAIIMGGSDGNGNRANNANKDGRFAGAHYVNAEEPVGIIRCTSGSSANELHMGGGTSLVNAATQLSFYTATNTTTTGGTEKMRLTADAGLAIVTAGSMSANAGNETLYIQGEGHNGHGISNTRSVVSIIGALTSNNSAAGLWIGTRTNENTAVIGTRTASGNLAFETYNGGWGERMRLLNTGQLLVGKSSLAAHPNMDDIQVGDGNGNRGITISSGTGAFGTVAFGDSADGSGNDRYEGYIEYYHNNDSLRLGTAHTEKVNIASNGDVRMGAASYGTPKTKLDIIEDQSIPYGVTVAGSAAMFVGAMVRTRYYLEFSCEFYQHSTNTSIQLKFSRSSNAPSISIDYFSGGGYQVDHGVTGVAYISFYSANGNTLYSGTNHQSAYGGATPSWSHSGGTTDVLFKLSNIAYSSTSMCHFRINMPRGGINNVTVDRTTP